MRLQGRPDYVRSIPRFTMEPRFEKVGDMRIRANGRSRGVAFGISALAMTAVLSACGGSSHSATPPVRKLSGSDLVLASVKTTAATKSAKVSLSMTVGGTESVAVKFDGAVDFETGDSQFTADLGGLMGSMMPGGLEMRVVNKVAYVKLPDSLAGFLGGAGGSGSGGKWLAIDAAKAHPGAPGGFSNLGQGDPTKFLAYLETVSDDVKQVGTDSVRGVETKHYKATLDLGKTIDQAKVPDSLREKLKGLLEQSGAQAQTIPVDVWVDNDGRVRRTTMQMQSATVTLELYDFGAPVNVEAPPADQIISMKDFGLNGGGKFGLPSPGSGSGSVSG